MIDSFEKIQSCVECVKKYSLKIYPTPADPRVAHKEY